MSGDRSEGKVLGSAQQRRLRAGGAEGGELDGMRPDSG